MRRIVLCLIGLLVGAQSFPAAQPVDCLRDIKPILARNCYSCHGPARQKAGLRLDTVAAALDGGDSGPAIIPGKSAASPLILSLTGGGDIRPMPPRGRGLSGAQVALLKRLIDEGARGPGQEEVDKGEGSARQKEDDDRDERRREFRKKWGEREGAAETRRREPERPGRDDD
jgi:hypothetical protein